LQLTGNHAENIGYFRPIALQSSGGNRQKKDCPTVVTVGRYSGRSVDSRWLFLWTENADHYEVRLHLFCFPHVRCRFLSHENRCLPTVQALKRPVGYICLGVVGIAVVVYEDLLLILNLVSYIYGILIVCSILEKNNMKQSLFCYLVYQTIVFFHTVCICVEPQHLTRAGA
jgi:hypothetical protein